MEERRKNQPGRGERRKTDAARIAETLKRRGQAAMYVQGTGMLPLVRPGDVALIRRDRLENMRSGDVVLFQRGSQLLAKRIGEEDSVRESTFAREAEERESEGGQIVEQECLGQIVSLQRKSQDIDLTAKETPIKALVSLVLKPARKVKQSLRLSNETSS